MKVKHLLLISLLIVGLLIPAVSAETIIDEELTFFEFTGGTYQSAFVSGSYPDRVIDEIKFENIENHPELTYIAFTVSSDVVSNVPADGLYEFTYTGLGEEKTGRFLVESSRNFLGVVTSYRYSIFFDDWDIGDLAGPQSIKLSRYLFHGQGATLGAAKNPVVNLGYSGGISNVFKGGYTISIASGKFFQNRLTVNDDLPNSYQINLQRVYDNKYYPSTINLKYDDTTVFTESSGGDFGVIYLKSDINNIEVIAFDKVYSFSLTEGIPGEPTPPQPTLRTGTVTMTDHNGTTIRGFDVRAVNYYTGEEYTASTDTDVATITLPMDRTIALRNPQTGQYEDVPVGYYLFFVSKPGYKMTSEDGVRISVLPEQYSSYHFGDIIVTSEDGYLTGKHQFQIRSRADLSILQTGTISAQSATTGEWFNTTVTDGIATLILPYDTSNPYYEYVGNYYVYATSPGYIPSEYATQISVRPDTQSEIRYILLTPIGGIPEAGNVTLRIQAVSDSGQGIPNAQIHIDGLAGAGWEVWESYTASATGYAEISVPENSTYDITVYGEGYYSSSQRIEVFTEDPPLLNIILYPTGAPTLTPTPQPTGWVTPPPTTQPSPGIPDEDDDSEGFLMEAIRGISRAFGVGFVTGKTIFGMLLALAIGFTTAKQLRGGAAEFGMGLLGGTLLGVLIGLLPVWVVVVLLLIVGMYVGYRYVGGSSNG